MKKFLILGLVLALTAVAYAELTPEQEVTVGQLHANKAKFVDLINFHAELKAIAESTGSEALPLEIAKKRQERLNLLASRDAEIQVVKDSALAQIQTIQDTYEVQIDSVESEIANLKSQLDALLNP